MSKTYVGSVLVDDLVLVHEHFLGAVVLFAENSHLGIVFLDGGSSARAALKLLNKMIISNYLNNKTIWFLKYLFLLNGIHFFFGLQDGIFKLFLQFALCLDGRFQF